MSDSQPSPTSTPREHHQISSRGALPAPSLLAPHISPALWPRSEPVETFAPAASEEEIGPPQPTPSTPLTSGVSSNTGVRGAPSPSFVPELTPSPFAWHRPTDTAATAFPRPLNSARSSLNHEFTQSIAPPSSERATSAPNILPRKRNLDLEYSPRESAPTSEPSAKRIKIRPRPKHTLGSFYNSSPAFSAALQPPSPLFFSNSPQPRPALPPRFSSSEAGARMLSKARTEDSHIKTVSLPRGTITTPGPSAHYSPIPSLPIRKSSERSTPDTGSYGGREGTGAMLNSIGIVELLEQDERPTFIVDLGDSTNYGPGTLHPIFINSALKSYEGMQTLVCGLHREDGSPAPTTVLQFKSWLLSAAVNGESLNVCLPPFNHAGMTWSCSTLRKRLRIVSGAFTSPTPTSTAAMRLSIPPSDGLVEKAPLETIAEPTDYFGKVPEFPPPPTAASSAEVMPSIEQTITDRKNRHSNGSISHAYTIESPKSADLYPHITSFGPTSSSTDPTPGATSVRSDPANPDHFPIDPADRNIQIATINAPSFDWTQIPVTDNTPDHIKFARSRDWASTSLGPIETWNADLRQMCNLIMASPHPAAMYWGEDLIAIYNEAYVLLAGQKHPRLMGMSYRDAWKEIWSEVEGVFDSARRTGEATMKDDDCLFTRRNNFLEETYFSWSIIPMVGSDGSVMGLYNPAFEKTRRKIAERRMLTLREVGERTASARDVKGFWEQVLGSFEFNEYDSPILLLYSVTDEAESDSASIHSNAAPPNRSCTLEGSLGIPEGHAAAPYQIDLKVGQDGFGPAFREAMKTDKPVLLEVGSRDLPEHLMESLEKRGFGDPVRAVVVCPIHPTTGESVLGFLVLGVNPRRPYDDDYSLFVQLLSRQLATSLASVVLFEEEIRRGQRAAKLAALDRIELSEQLAARTQEAIDSETKFTRMAEFAPVGMFIASASGKIIFANDTWYDISHIPKNSGMADTWMDVIHSEDKILVQSLWNEVVVKKKPVSEEFRFKARWEDRNGITGDTWVLFSCYPERHRDGELKSIFGSITDISQQKWAEGIQTRKMEEAVELKRQQENFIDITSHEMRNPLSAILQCSDEIATSLANFRQSAQVEIPDELLVSCLDAAQTISLCSQHQKRIVDDILTLSKLDSQLLLVTPVDAQPLTVVQRALKMHEGELQAADIQMRFVVHQSFRDLELDWVRCDPSRVLQVLINLTTNAIKFTGSETKRTITVTIAASLDRPSERADAPVKYFPTRTKNRDTMSEREWGEGEKVYIHFAVRDTGRGLSPEEKKLLFIRFSQASPRTHVQYGGSGLGLFISRELTELQGGEIGVESEAGKGSTFAFYIAARKTTAPPDQGETMSNLIRSPADARSRSLPVVHPRLPLPSSRQDSGTNGDLNIPKKVLIVEDNLVNQKVLQKQLKNLGTEVHLANHGGEALETLKRSTYWSGDPTDGTDGKIEIGVVLMDQEMPVMDGLTCTRKIRELEAEGKLIGHVPIIAVTANARAEQVQTALNAGMDDVVSKPFRIPELIPKIEELLQRFPMPQARHS